MKHTRYLLLFALAVLLLGGLGWLVLPPRDPLFHGKRESEWITNIVYGMHLSEEQNREQGQRWRDFGREGLRVLERGLAKAPRARAYRMFHRQLEPKLPRALVRLLPAPRMDTQSGTRMCVLDLLWRMGKDARSAWPAVARALEDEDPGVRGMAIVFFTHPEDDTAFLNQMPAVDKRKLLPLFIRALEDTGANWYWSLRNNAALALKYYPEQAPRVAPPLAKALHDPVPYVRLTSAEALNRVDPDAAKQAGAMTVMIKLLQDPDDQVASRAASVLRQFQQDADAAVVALIETLHGTNISVGCNAVWALEWAFPKHADKIIPELRKATEREDNVGSCARVALEHLESKTVTR